MIGFREWGIHAENMQKTERERYGLVHCPYCGKRLFWKRCEKGRLKAEGETMLICRNCAGVYWVVLNYDGKGTHIRANRTEGV